MKRLIRLSLLSGVLAIAGSTAPAITTEVDCQDCRPAPDRWKCDGDPRSCNLLYEKCRDLPL